MRRTPFAAVLFLPWLCLAAAPTPQPSPKPADLAAGTVLEFELPELGNSAHSFGHKPIRAQVRLPSNWDKDHAFPLWVHVGGEDGYDEKGLDYFSSVFDRKNLLLMTVDFPAKDTREKALPTLILAIKRFVTLTQAKVDFRNLALSGYAEGARAMEANAKAGGRELAAFRFRVVMGGGKLKDLARNPGPPAHWLRVDKKPLQAFTALEQAGHDCTTLETRQAPMALANQKPIAEWFTHRFAPTRLAAERMQLARRQADHPEAQARALAPVADLFFDFAEINDAKAMLAKARAAQTPEKAGQ